MLPKRKWTAEGSVWKRDTLLSGHIIDGPAVIDQLDTTSIVLPGQKANVDNWGNMLISEVLT